MASFKKAAVIDKGDDPLTSLISEFSKTLNIADEKKKPSSVDSCFTFHERIGLFAWFKKASTEKYSSSNIAVDDIVDLFSDYVHIHQPLPLSMPKLVHQSKLPSSIRIQPYRKIVGPSVKPNLLAISGTILLDCTRNDASITEASPLLVKAFKGVDFVATRNPIVKGVMRYPTSHEMWIMFVCKPMDDGPLFIERTEGYESNEGSIGTLFENALIEEGGYDRVYAVSKVSFGELIVVLSGEVDAFDESDRVVEIKSRPSWARFHSDRQLQNYTQSALVGVDLLVTGSFNSQRGVKDGPVTFNSRDIKIEMLEEYGRKISDFRKQEAFDYTSEVLREIKSHCTEIGKVYRVSAGTAGGALIAAREVDMSDACIVSGKLLENCSVACLKIAGRLN